ncbi:alkyl hydroperoxide reductase/thiol specific antioxidant/Mal allergen [Fibrella aestuarina BUZ 2]|uniref:Alkyl hydroperoxide reductase/thiol specific antioxidant/Mal allergen n=1 Tax=Fibrella aestuarina BUZ 2 TaxID=1166018 RepID=I0K1M8_9BACT|nr:thioredoxin-like domain-containing protein [Fibrella aestuarina]CCG98031.1 alkyl hydroperoxide reductase/thiol specific antioxidant/Mal allergen [Fibrella aestuarina BUZ 2]
MNVRNYCMLLLGLGLGVVSLLASAQSPEGHRIAGRIRGLKDTTVVLAHYQYDATHYVPKDTARVDAGGNFVFQSRKKLPEGLYLVVLPKGRYFDLMLAEQQFSFETDTTDLIGSLKSAGSVENAAFYGYQHKLKSIFDQMGKLDKLPKSDVTAQQMKALQTEAATYRKEFLAKNPKLLTSKILLASADPDVPAPPKAANGRPDSIWQFNYYKNHFWDNFDLTDDRMLRTSLLQPRIDRYIKELTFQQVDSLTKEADMLIKRAGPSKDMRNYLIWYLTSQYERPKVLGTDGLFIHLVENYWLKGQFDNLDSTTRKTLTERVAILKPLQVGKPFQMPVVGDTLTRPINLAQATTGADYTVMFFYAPHCGHCREAAPKVKQFTDSPAGKGVKVVAVAIEDSADDWKKFIREFKLTNWVNGYDHSQRIDFRRQYDVYSTPTVYVLDKNRKIIARALPAEDIGNFIEFSRKQAASKAPAASATTKPAPKQKVSGR